MGHTISAIIVKKESYRNSVINKVVDKQDDFLTISKYAELNKGLLLFPFGSTYQFKKEGFVSPQEVVNQGHDILCSELSLDYRECVYVETDYFGGYGDQSASYYKDGKLIYEDLNSHGCINECLSRMGIVRDKDNYGKVDEFDTIGLGKFRTNESIIKWYDENKI